MVVHRNSDVRVFGATRWTQKPTSYNKSGSPRDLRYKDDNSWFVETRPEGLHDLRKASSQSFLYMDTHEAKYMRGGRLEFGRRVILRNRKNTKEKKSI